MQRQHSVSIQQSYVVRPGLLFKCGRRRKLYVAVASCRVHGWL